MEPLMCINCLKHYQTFKDLYSIFSKKDMAIVFLTDGFNFKRKIPKN